MHILLHWLDNPDTIIVVKSKLTKIKKLRKFLYNKFHVPPKLQRLYYGDKMLENDCTFHDYNIKSNDVIQFMVLPQIEDIVIEEKLESKPTDYVNNNITTEHYKDAESELYTIGDLVDVRDKETGAWFEGKIVSIVNPNPPSILDTNVSIDEGSSSHTKPISFSDEKDLENNSPEVSIDEGSSSHTTEPIEISDESDLENNPSEVSIDEGSSFHTTEPIEITDESDIENNPSEVSIDEDSSSHTTEPMEISNENYLENNQPEVSIDEGSSSHTTEPIDVSDDNDLENNPPEKTNYLVKSSRVRHKCKRKISEKEHPKIERKCDTVIDLLYKVKLDLDEQDSKLYCQEKDIRPRARTIIEPKNLKVGQEVMINYNPKYRTKKGYWYDFKISEVIQRRKYCRLFGTLYLGPEAVPQNYTNIKIHDKIFAKEVVVPLAKRTDDQKMMIEIPEKRSYPLNCLSCPDDDSAPCKECGCFICSRTKKIPKEYPEGYLEAEVEKLALNKKAAKKGKKPAQQQIIEEFTPSYSSTCLEMIEVEPKTPNESLKDRRVTYGLPSTEINSQSDSDMEITEELPSTDVNSDSGSEMEGACREPISPKKYQSPVTDEELEAIKADSLNAKAWDGCLEACDSLGKKYPEGYLEAEGEKLALKKAAKKGKKPAQQQIIEEFTPSYSSTCLEMIEVEPKTPKKWLKDRRATFGFPSTEINSQSDSDMEITEELPSTDVNSDSGSEMEGACRRPISPKKYQSPLTDEELEAIKADSLNAKAWDGCLEACDSLGKKYPEGYLEAEGEKLALKKTAKKGKKPAQQQIIEEFTPSYSSTCLEMIEVEPKTPKKWLKDRRASFGFPSTEVNSDSGSEMEGACRRPISPKKYQSPLTDEELEAIKADSLNAKAWDGCLEACDSLGKKYPEGYLEAEGEKLALKKTAKKGKKPAQQQIIEEFTPSYSSTCLEMIEVEPKTPKKWLKDRRATFGFPSTEINSQSDSDMEITEELPSTDVNSDSGSEMEGACRRPISPKKYQSPLTDEELEAIKADSLNAKAWDGCLEACDSLGKKYPEGYLEAEGEKLALKKTAKKGKKPAQQQIIEEFTPSYSSTCLEMIEVEPKTPKKWLKDRRASFGFPSTEVNSDSGSEMEGACRRPISPKKYQSPLTDEELEAIKADSLNAKAWDGCLEACDSLGKKYPEGYLEAEGEKLALKKTAKKGKKPAQQQIIEEFTPSYSSTCLEMIEVEPKTPKKWLKDRRASFGFPSTEVNSDSGSEMEGACRRPISPKKYQSPLTDEELEAIKADSLNAKAWDGCLEACDSLGKKEFVARVMQEFLCIICQEVAADPVTTPCLHNFCQGCLKLSLRMAPGCPYCRGTLARRHITVPNNELKTALQTILKGYDQGRRKPHFAL